MALKLPSACPVWTAPYRWSCLLFWISKGSKSRLAKQGFAKSSLSSRCGTSSRVLKPRWPSPEGRSSKNRRSPAEFPGSGYALRGVRCLRLGWNNGLDNRPGVAISQSQFPAKFLDALPPSCNANANLVGLKIRNGVWDALPIVAHHNEYLTFPYCQTNACFMRFRMAVDIGKRLLNDTEYGGF